MPKKKTDKQVPIGKKIKKARTVKKLTYDQLANDTGFSVDYLKEIESGKTTPPVGTLLQIARALEIDARNAVFWFNQAVLLRKANRLAEGVHVLGVPVSER